MPSTSASTPVERTKYRSSWSVSWRLPCWGPSRNNVSKWDFFTPKPDPVLRPGRRWAGIVGAPRDEASLFDLARRCVRSRTGDSNWDGLESSSGPAEERAEEAWEDKGGPEERLL